MRERATFKAVREAVGMSQQRLADELGVNVKSVKRWETPAADGTDWYRAPDDAWDVLLKAQAAQRAQVDAFLLAFYGDNGEPRCNPVTLPYWRTAAEFEAAYPDIDLFADYQMANAASRALYSILDADGIEVDFAYGEPETRLF